MKYVNKEIIIIKNYYYYYYYYYYCYYYYYYYYYRRNTFNVPSGRAGKSFIEELTFWIKQFNSDSVALKAFMVLPTLILQKPSATSKSKEHGEAIKRRLALWKQGEIDLLP